LRLATLALLLTSLHAIWALIVNGTVIAIAVVVVVGFAAGHVLGGASSEWTDRSRPRRWLPPPCRRPCHRGGKLVGAAFCRCDRAVPVARRHRRPAVHDLATTQPRFAHLCRGGGNHSGCAGEGSRRPPGGTRGAVLSRSLDRAEPIQQRDLAVVGQRRRCRQGGSEQVVYWSRLRCSPPRRALAASSARGNPPLRLAGGNPNEPWVPTPFRHGQPRTRHKAHAKRPRNATLERPVLLRFQSPPALIAGLIFGNVHGTAPNCGWRRSILRTSRSISMQASHST